MLAIDFNTYAELVVSRDRFEKETQSQRKKIVDLEKVLEHYSYRIRSLTYKMDENNNRLHKVVRGNGNLYLEAKALKEENTKLREALEKIANYDAQHVAITALRGVS